MQREVLHPSFDTTGQRLTWAETKAAPASSRTLRSIVDDRLRFVERSKGYRYIDGIRYNRSIAL